MKKATFIIIAVLVCVFSLLHLRGYAQTDEPQQIDSSQLNKTTVTSYLQENIALGKNVLYCSTFQIAWNELIDGIVKAPLQLTGDPVIARMLNERLTGKQDISEDCYVAMAGLNNDGIVEKIKKALKDKFNTEPGIDISLQNPTDILAYAFLLKDLKFDNEFEPFEYPMIFRGTTPVKSFGIKSYSLDEMQTKIAEQVEILSYNNDDDFVISLKSSSPQDEIILAKVEPQPILVATIDSMLGRIAGAEPSSLQEREILCIPEFDFDLLHSYSELVNKDILNKGFTTYFIAKAVQSIRFRLNKKGALLKSEAAIVMQKAMTIADMNYKPRYLVFNKPFLICLREKGAHYPYFAMWVDNTELLVKE